MSHRVSERGPVHGPASGEPSAKAGTLRGRPIAWMSRGEAAATIVVGLLVILGTLLFKYLNQAQGVQKDLGSGWTKGATIGAGVAGGVVTTIGLVHLAGRPSEAPPKGAPEPSPGFHVAAPKHNVEPPVVKLGDDPVSDMARAVEEFFDARPDDLKQSLERLKKPLELRMEDCEGILVPHSLAEDVHRLEGPANILGRKVNFNHTRAAITEVHRAITEQAPSPEWVAPMEVALSQELNGATRILGDAMTASVQNAQGEPMIFIERPGREWLLTKNEDANRKITIFAQSRVIGKLITQAEFETYARARRADPSAAYTGVKTSTPEVRLVVDVLIQKMDDNQFRFIAPTLAMQDAATGAEIYTM
jgi:hypothetical protein